VSTDDAGNATMEFEGELLYNEDLDEDLGVISATQDMSFKDH
jgi:hypothetical protein